MTPDNGTEEEELGVSFPSPLVLRLARDNDIDVGTVLGTGVGGQVPAGSDGTSE